ncbi:hypothetical protein M2354_004586 [Leclercia adecarboxylata]|nr:hypothetical protein [Leclercia adecarboxylata]
MMINKQTNTKNSLPLLVIAKPVRWLAGIMRMGLPFSKTIKPFSHTIEMQQKPIFHTHRELLAVFMMMV